MLAYTSCNGQRGHINQTGLAFLSLKAFETQLIGAEANQQTSRLLVQLGSAAVSATAASGKPRHKNPYCIAADSKSRAEPATTCSQRWRPAARVPPCGGGSGTYGVLTGVSGPDTSAVPPPSAPPPGGDGASASGGVTPATSHALNSAANWPPYNMLPSTFTLQSSGTCDSSAPQEAGQELREAAPRHAAAAASSSATSPRHPRSSSTPVVKFPSRGAPAGDSAMALQVCVRDSTACAALSLPASCRQSTNWNPNSH
mmetsp:Transcript_19850/g.59960  ORF Transcript_19850/g.59960 Transcript_19850/m.59960 type:complete len:257 (-) Transcript_19850:929-1699(-)